MNDVLYTEHCRFPRAEACVAVDPAALYQYDSESTSTADQPFTSSSLHHESQHSSYLSAGALYADPHCLNVASLYSEIPQGQTSEAGRYPSVYDAWSLHRRFLQSHTPVASSDVAASCVTSCGDTSDACLDGDDFVPGHFGGHQNLNGQQWSPPINTVYSTSNCHQAVYHVPIHPPTERSVDHVRRHAVMTAVNSSYDGSCSGCNQSTASSSTGSTSSSGCSSTPIFAACSGRRVPSISSGIPAMGTLSFHAHGLRSKIATDHYEFGPPSTRDQQGSRLMACFRRFGEHFAGCCKNQPSSRKTHTAARSRIVVSAVLILIVCAVISVGVFYAGKRVQWNNGDDILSDDDGYQRFIGSFTLTNRPFEKSFILQDSQSSRSLFSQLENELTKLFGRTNATWLVGVRVLRATVVERSSTASGSGGVASARQSGHVTSVWLQPGATQVVVSLAVAKNSAVDAAVIGEAFIEGLRNSHGRMWLHHFNVDINDIFFSLWTDDSDVTDGVLWSEWGEWSECELIDHRQLSWRRRSCLHQLKTQPLLKLVTTSRCVLLGDGWDTEWRTCDNSGALRRSSSTNAPVLAREDTWIRDENSSKRQNNDCVGQFRCTNGQCRNPALLCDGFPDCDDGSDELDGACSEQRGRHDRR